MNCELFSIRGNQEEINRLNQNLGAIVTGLAKLDIQILFKTEIDRSTSKIEEAIINSVNDQSSPEIIIIANAIDETCGADFQSVFSKIIYNWETRYKNSLPIQDRNKQFHVKVFTIDNLGCGQNGYCFTIYNTRIIVLPSETLAQKNIEDLIFEATTCALNKFRGSNLLFPNGFDFSNGTQEPAEETQSTENNEIYSNSEPEPTDEEQESVDITSSQEEENTIPKDIEFIPEPLSKKEEKKLKKAEKKKNKKGFFRRNFPCKGDKPLEIVRKSVVLVAFVTIVVCVAMIVNEVVILPAQNEKRQNEIQNIFYNKPTANTEIQDETEETEETSETEPEEISYNWDALKEINDEIIGWISIDNTVIDYPVLSHEGDEPGTTNPYYLTHNYADQWDSYGSIFTDPTSYGGLDTKNIVLHGHHMNDGSMFGNLAYYGTGFADGNGTPNVNLDFYKSAPIVHFNTPEWNADWKIIAVIHTNALESHGEFFNYLAGNFSSDEEFLDFVYDVRERSIIDTDVAVNEDDQLITLSTCTYEFENFRTAVIARRVRPGEDSTVNVDNASVNTDMVWPDVYYWTYGGTKPEDKSFAEAYADGEISWYDGDLYSSES